MDENIIHMIQYYTELEAIEHCDATVLSAKNELKIEISSFRKQKVYA